jgi:hypothetical protein
VISHMVSKYKGQKQLDGRIMRKPFTLNSLRLYFF